MPGYEAAWAAGFFDGEGSTHVRKSLPRHNRDYAVLRVSISQKERELIDRFQEATGGHGRTYHLANSRSGYHPEGTHFRWEASNRRACCVLEVIVPYLGSIKRTQAREALARYNTELCKRRAYAGKSRWEEVAGL